jgi:hypothetical protein
MKPIPQMSLTAGYFCQEISREDAAEILWVSRRDARESGTRFRRSGPNRYEFGSLRLYTCIES